MGPRRLVHEKPICVIRLGCFLNFAFAQEIGESQLQSFEMAPRSPSHNSVVQVRPQQQVLPQQRVSERLLVRAEQR